MSLESYRAGDAVVNIRTAEARRHRPGWRQDVFVDKMNTMKGEAVAGAPSTEFGEEIVAFVVASRPIDAAAPCAACRRRLAAYKAPSRILFRGGLPKNAAGKVIKPGLARIAAR
jgi:acyl-CoA synthetase (AMP-forming)/AMP-acid ligase II